MRERSAAARDVVVTEPLHYSPEARTLLARIGPIVEGPFERDELLRAVESARVLVVRLAHDVDDALLDAAPFLEFVASPTTGLDHIDLAAAEARGIRVVSLRGEREFLDTVRATPEHTWALLLALVRRLPAAAAAAAAGRWDRDEFRGRELFGKRLGIVGVGRVGTIVAGYARAFGMEVHGYDPGSVAAGDVQMVRTLPDLLDRSDVLLLHLPLDDSTHHVLGAAELERLPRGAFLVNTSRGGVIDEAALVDALQRGHLGGVAVDVLEQERDADERGNSPLLRYAAAHPERAIVTPHIAGVTWESMHRTEVFLAERLVALAASEPEPSER